MLARSIEGGGRALVVGLSGEELFSAAVIALALEGHAEEVVLAHVGDGGPWAAPIATWWATQSHPVEVVEYASPAGFDRVFAAGTGIARDLPDALRAHRRALFALVGAGAHAAELDATRAALMGRAAAGALREVTLIPRYGRVGRALIELIEEVHHAVGPERQSRVADTLRAALFGRSGRVPVNLAARDDPPELDPLTLLVWFLSPPPVR